MRQSSLLLIFLLTFCLSIVSSQSEPLPIHHDGSAIRGVTFSADSERMLSWGGETARIWDVSTGEIIFEISPRPNGMPPYPGGGVNSARWNEDETQLTISYQQGSHSAFRIVWDIQTGEQLSIDTICTGSCGFSGNNSAWKDESNDVTGNRVANWNNEHCSENCDFSLILTEADGTTLVFPHQQRIKHAYWSPEGNYLITTTVPLCDECTSPLHIWSVTLGSDNYGERLTTIDTSCLVWDIQWSDDESQFFLRSDGVWRVAFGGTIDSCHASWQAFSIEGNLLWRHDEFNWSYSYEMYLNEAENSLIISGHGWSIPVDEERFPRYDILSLDTNNGNILETQIMTGFAPRGFTYQVSNSEFIVWNLRTLEEFARFELQSPLRIQGEGATIPDGSEGFTSERYIPEIDWLREYDLAYARTTEDYLYLWSTETWEIIFTPNTELRFRDPILNDDNQTLILTASAENCDTPCTSSGWLFDLETHDILFSIDIPNENITRMQSLNENQVAVMTDCETCPTKLYVYDIETSHLVLQDEGSRLSIIEANDNWLSVHEFIGYAYPQPLIPLRFWNLENGELLLSLDTFGYEVSPQEEKILIYGEEATSIYDFATGEKLFDFAFTPGNRGLWDWSPDGRIIVFEVGSNRLADVYSAETGEWLFPNRQG